MNIIAAVDNNWGIGYNGDLLIKIPNDMRYFRKLTLDKVVVMGNVTFKSLPGSKPLDKRENVILSRSNVTIEGCTTCNSLENLLKALACYDTGDIFVIGGQQIYELLLPYCSVAYITKINALMEADCYFPNLDELENWVTTEESEIETHNGVNYRFLKYINNSTKNI